MSVMVGKKLTFRTYVHSDVCIVVDRLDRYLIADDNLLKPPPGVFPSCPVSTPSTFDFPDVPDTVPAVPDFLVFVVFVFVFVHGALHGERTDHLIGQFENAAVKSM